MKRSKKYKAAAEKIKLENLYMPGEAMKLVKETSTVKYDATVDVALFLGVDPKKADQAIRSTVNLPHGTGKTARVLVFAGGERAEEARAAGADIVGADELIDEGIDTLTSIEKIQFSDKTISTISLKYSLSETIDSTQNILKSYSTETLSGTQNFNSGDNIIIADGQAKTLRGLDGDDTYFISNLLPENSSITIIDTSGTNTIQIPSNTKVTKSQWANDTVRLTFEDSRVITVNNADTFSYNLGGNVTNGEVGTDLSFSDFARTFGIDDLSDSGLGIYTDLYII